MTQSWLRPWTNLQRPPKWHSPLLAFHLACKMKSNGTSKDTSQFYFIEHAHLVALMYQLLFNSIHGFKSIGYVHLVPSTPIHSSSYIQSQSKLESTRNYHGTSSFLSSYILAVAMAVVALAAAFLLPYLSVFARAFSSQWRSDELSLFPFIAYILSFLHPSLLFALSHIESLSLWLLSFTLLGWELNYSGLVQSRAMITQRKIRNSMIKSENSTFRKRGWILLRELYSCWLGSIIHTYKDRYHIFGLSPDAKNSWSCELWMPYSILVSRLNTVSQSCNSKGKSKEVYHASS